jgi:hypothetical protein
MPLAPMMPTMLPLGTLKLTSSKQQPVAVGLAQAAHLDDLVAEARPRRYVDLVGLVATLEFL